MPYSTSFAEHERNYHGVLPDPTDPPPPSGGGPSGIAIPAVKAGWQRAGVTDFPDTIQTGSWTGDKQGVLMGRPSGDDTSKRGTYSLKGISQHDSLLDLRGYKDATGYHTGCPLNKVAGGTTDPKGVLDLRVEVAMKLDAPNPDFKIAFMVAKYGTVRSQEFDYPECQFNATGQASGWVHASGNDKRFPIPAGQSMYEWHRFAIERLAGESVEYFFDGQSIGKYSSGMTQDRVHWIGQLETRIGGDPLSQNPKEAHVLIDWITIDVAA